MVKAPFYISELCPSSVKELLLKTTLGTNGAMYQHQDTEQRLAELDNPLFFGVERNGKALGNITFCRRDKNWYIRYFAFDAIFHAGEKRRKNETKSRLKEEVHQFFEQQLSAQVACFYAYIDPKNERSVAMSKQFGFEEIGQIKTQSFSRIQPKKKVTLHQCSDWTWIQELLHTHFADHRFYTPIYSSKARFYYVLNEANEIVACANVLPVTWKIVRLPGKYGALLTRSIPYIPFLRKLIRPQNHQFLALDSVYTKNQDSTLLSDLFESILAAEKQTVALWWTDVNEPIYTSSKANVKWGLLHKLLGNPTVSLVCKGKKPIATTPFYVSSVDLV